MKASVVFPWPFLSLLPSPTLSECSQNSYSRLHPHLPHHPHPTPQLLVLEFCVCAPPFFGFSDPSLFPAPSILQRCALSFGSSSIRTPSLHILHWSSHCARSRSLQVPSFFLTIVYYTRNKCMQNVCVVIYQAAPGIHVGMQE